MKPPGGVFTKVSTESVHSKLQKSGNIQTILMPDCVRSKAPTPAKKRKRLHFKIRNVAKSCTIHNIFYHQEQIDVPDTTIKRAHINYNFTALQCRTGYFGMLPDKKIFS